MMIDDNLWWLMMIDDDWWRLMTFDDENDNYNHDDYEDDVKLSKKKITNTYTK